MEYAKAFLVKKQIFLYTLTRVLGQYSFNIYALVNDHKTSLKCAVALRGSALIKGQPGDGVLSCSFNPRGPVLSLMWSTGIFETFTFPTFAEISGDTKAERLKIRAKKDKSLPAKDVFSLPSSVPDAGHPNGLAVLGIRLEDVVIAGNLASAQHQGIVTVYSTKSMLNIKRTDFSDDPFADAGESVQGLFTLKGEKAVVIVGRNKIFRCRIAAVAQPSTRTPTPDMAAADSHLRDGHQESPYHAGAPSEGPADPVLPPPPPPPVDNDALAQARRLVDSEARRGGVAGGGVGSDGGPGAGAGAGAAGVGVGAEAGAGEEDDEEELLHPPFRRPPPPRKHRGGGAGAESSTPYGASAGRLADPSEEELAEIRAALRDVQRERRQSRADLEEIRRVAAELMEENERLKRAPADQQQQGPSRPSSLRSGEKAQRRESVGARLDSSTGRISFLPAARAEALGMDVGGDGGGGTRSRSGSASSQRGWLEAPEESDEALSEALKRAEAAEAEVKRAEARLQAKEGAHAKAVAALAERDAEVAELGAKLRAAQKGPSPAEEERIRALVMKLEAENSRALAQENEALKAELAEARARLQDERESHDAERRILETVIDKLNSPTGGNDAVLEANEQLVLRLNDANNKLAEAEAARRGLEADCRARIEDARIALQMERRVWQEEREGLEAELAEARRGIDLLEDRIAELRRDKVDYRRDHERELGSLRHLHRQLTEAASSGDPAAYQLAVQEWETATATLAFDNSDKTNHQLKEKLEAADRKLEAALKAKKRSEARVKELETQLAETKALAREEAQANALALMRAQPQASHPADHPAQPLPPRRAGQHPQPQSQHQHQPQHQQQSQHQQLGRPQPAPHPSQPFAAASLAASYSPHAPAAASAGTASPSRPSPQKSADRALEEKYRARLAALEGKVKHLADEVDHVEHHGAGLSGSGTVNRTRGDANLSGLSGISMSSPNTSLVGSLRERVSVMETSHKQKLSSLQRKHEASLMVLEEQHSKNILMKEHAKGGKQRGGIGGGGGGDAPFSIAL